MRLPALLLLILVLAPAAPAVIAGPDLLEPGAATALLEGTDDDAYEGAARLLLFDRTEVEVEESGLSHVFQHRFLKVLDWEGARGLRAVRFDYDPATNLTEFRAVRIHRKEGGHEDVDLTTVLDSEAPAHLIFWGGRMLVLPLPALEPGDGVETITYKKGFQIAYLDAGGEDEKYIPPMRGHFYDVVLFRDADPMLEKQYTVHVPRDKPLQYSIYNEAVMSSLTFGEESFIYHFWIHDAPAAPEERRAPDLSDYVPKVVMATVSDWPEKSRWFYKVNEDREIFAWTPEIKEKVDEITAGMKSDDERIAALLHWVAQNIRYSGLNMGEGEGYTIHPGIMSFRDRAGVCKDIAGMLVTMLRAAGYPTFAAMTMAGARVEAIPADQFNHCVVALQKEDGSYLMLDPTWAPWNNPLWSRWEGEQHYVIGSEKGEELMMIPAFKPEDNLFAIRSDARILPDGALEGTLRFEGKGISDGRIRSAVGDQPKHGRRAFLEGWLGAIDPRVELIDVDITDHRDFTIDSVMRLTYRVPGYADRLGDDLAFHSPALLFITRNERISRLHNVPESDERTTGVFLYGPQKVTIDETVRLPGGYEAEAPEGLDKDGTLAAARLDWNAEGSRLVLNAEYELKNRFVTVDGYPDVIETIRELREKTEADLFATR
ncbi:MAG: DUF3857 and transglutaminase domain-containing protein [Candidatus Eisenbacteria bacterium]|nr:DUF3857 and transglutaminase domain-containing protein [Candidatus Eisenbacteria bacterium]